ncbi:general transcription factor II-I repeat domain-containing protein 2-like [Aphis craccivora]|uniref:General transcription factor II-I repeat domain-containing protein 2-like n=1 Tax=Aphis craccivora TaxID=307492 RepID=A0A6G0VVX7_APHCR|nr:general transcription factor II-I repeat domain-containing protein 2-like [Aphis craccivora]
MEQYNFLNFKELIGKVFVHKKINIDGEAVGWNKIRWMKYMTNNFDLTKKTRRSCELGELHVLHTNLLPLEAKKLKDLQSLLPFISESSRPFYYSLINNSTTCRSSEEESD